jgi:hypothetical protein
MLERKFPASDVLRPAVDAHERIMRHVANRLGAVAGKSLESHRWLLSAPSRRAAVAKRNGMSSQRQLKSIGSAPDYFDERRRHGCRSKASSHEGNLSPVT